MQMAVQQQQQQVAESQQQIQNQQQAFEADQNEKDRVVKLEVERMKVATKVSSDADGNGRRDDIDRQRLEIERKKVDAARSKG